MTNPDYAINFINTTTTVMATIFGFTIIFFVFWYENIGQHLKSKLGTKLKGFRLKKYYGKFEKNFFNSFKEGRIPFTKFSYGKILKFTRIESIYCIIKEKTENRFFKYKYDQLNYKKISLFIIFMILVMLGIVLILDNIRVLYTITKFSEEQLKQDPTLLNILGNIYDNFVVFMMIVFIFVLIIVGNSIGYEKSNKGQK